MNMSNITFCENKTCPMRENCKRSKYLENTPAEYFATFQYGYGTHYKNYPYGEYDVVSCPDQILVTDYRKNLK